MLDDACLSNRYWAEAVTTAVYLKNISPTKALKKTPYEAWYGWKPTLIHLHAVFGCLAFVHVLDERCKKLDFKSIPGILIGYSTTKQYRIYDPVAKKLHVSRDVVFREGSHYQQLRNSNQTDLGDHFVSIPLDTVVPDLPDIPVLMPSTIQPSEDLLKTGPQKTEESLSDVMEALPDASRVARLHAKGKGSRLLNELQSGLGLTYGIPTTEEGQ